MHRVCYSAKELHVEKFESAITFAGSDNQYHLGLMHRKLSQNFKGYKHLHLAGHNDFRNDTFEDGRYLIIYPDLDLRLSRQVATLCRNIYNQNSYGEMPYGFTIPRAWFELSGDPKFDKGFVGLTCSTFVLSVFFSINIQLLLPHTWKCREDDREYQLMWVNFLFPKLEADQTHIRKVKKQIGNIRIRPEEVAGAALEAPPPVEFDRAIALSKDIKKNFDSFLTTSKH